MRHIQAFSGVILAAGLAFSAASPLAAQVQVVLTDGVKKVRIDRAKLGARKVGTALKVDRAALKKTLARIAPRFSAPARNARVAARGNSVRIVPSIAARKLDVNASMHRVAGLLEKDPSTRVLRLVVTKKAPALSTIALKGVRGVLSRFSTQYNPGNKKRAHNLRLAAKRLDGRLLPPGRVLSLNQVVGERTQKNGFLTATVIEYGKRVPGIGGGASQVAGTLFNAAVLGGLDIEQYQTHRRPIPYLPVARDATLSEQIDLKVKNSTKAPIYIAAKPSGGTLTVTLYGAPVSGRKIGVAVNKKKLAPTHIKAELYRIVKQNGKVVNKERIGQSEYKWVDEKAAAKAARLQKAKKARLAKGR